MIKRLVIFIVCLSAFNLCISKPAPVFDEELARRVVHEIQEEPKPKIRQDKIDALNKAIDSQKKAGGVSTQNKRIPPKKMNRIKAAKPMPETEIPRVLENYTVTPKKIVTSNLKTNKNTGMITNNVTAHIPVPVAQEPDFFKWTEVFFNVVFGIALLVGCGFIAFNVYKDWPWRDLKSEDK